MTDKDPQELPTETPPPVNKYLAMVLFVLVVMAINFLGLWWLHNT